MPKDGAGWGIHFIPEAQISMATTLRTLAPGGLTLALAAALG
jgi:hypothetical protein